METLCRCGYSEHALKRVHGSCQAVAGYPSVSQRHSNGQHQGERQFMAYLWAPTALARACLALAGLLGRSRRCLLFRNTLHTLFIHPVTLSRLTRASPYFCAVIVVVRAWIVLASVRTCAVHRCLRHTALQLSAGPKPNAQPCEVLMTTVQAMCASHCTLVLPACPPRSLFGPRELSYQRQALRAYPPAKGAAASFTPSGRNRIILRHSRTGAPGTFLKHTLPPRVPDPCSST